MSTKVNIVVRVATIDDLPSIQSLIRESFNAMLDYYPSLASIMESTIQDINSPNGDLHKDTFNKVYYGQAFWVAEDVQENYRTIVGSIGLKRLTNDAGELVPMSVTSSLRGGGVGHKLFSALHKFCVDKDILRVVLYTGNPGAANFYKSRCGFGTLVESKRDIRGTLMSLYTLIRYFGERIIRKVAVVGGTHGNERMGVSLASQWMQPDAREVTRDSFETTVLFGNPDAVAGNRRFVDADLNRQFLTTAAALATADSTSTTESRRALELQSMLGRKRRFDDRVDVTTATDPSCQSSPVDFIIDLHSSNSNVGLVCMISAGEFDPMATRLAHYLQQRYPELRITFSPNGKMDSWSVDSISTYGVAFEVGPCTHGVIDFELLRATRNLVGDSLDFIHEHNSTLESLRGESTGNIIRAELPVHIASPRESIKVFSSVSYVYFPEVTPTVSTSDGALRYAVHPSLVNKDFQPIRVGDPAFISLDGNDTVMPFSYPLDEAGKEVPTHNQVPLFLLFVNEASYAVRNIAFAVYSQSDKYVF